MTTKQEIIELIKNDKKSLIHFPEYQDNKEVVLEAVKKNGWNLDYASERLKADKEVVLEAIKQNGFTLYCAADNLKDNEQMVLEATKQSGKNFDFISDRLKNNTNFTLKIKEIIKLYDTQRN